MEMVFYIINGVGHILFYLMGLLSRLNIVSGLSSCMQMISQYTDTVFKLYCKL